jgi:hypothetical protein
MRKDILWKGIIEEVFDDLLKFIFPEAEECFDLRQKFTFLDKELAELYPEPDKSSGTRLADKLIKVYRRDGGKSGCLFIWKSREPAKRISLRACSSTIIGFSIIGTIR